MGLDPNLAIMMSGIATIIFLLIVNGKVPSYLGTSASFVGGVVAVRASGGDSADVVGAILVSGVVLALKIGRASCRGKSVDLGGRRIIKKKKHYDGLDLTNVTP